jgi:hypothetical protein
MDKFAKYALIVMLAIVLIMTASAYVGYIVGGNTATDTKVNAAAGSNGNTYYNPFTIEHWGVNGEYIGFFSAGSVGGFLVGYIFPTIFKTNVVSRRKN